ncbi:fibronectin type III domain-containing protein, partial [Paenibacillus sepulcri]|nr:fibronectin type III domain-containing protein [Paenibacillus sepulcri]
MKRSFRIALVYVTLVALMFSMFGGAVTADGGTATGAPVPGDAVSGIPSEDEDAPDTEAPAAPAGLHVAGTTSTSVSLSWNAPDPNSGTVTYAVYNGGASAGTTDHTQFVVTGLLPS